MPELTKERFEKLKSEVERVKSEAQQAAGAHQALLKRLKEEFGCDSLKEANAKLKDLRAELEAAEEQFEKLLKRYEKEWHGL